MATMHADREIRGTAYWVHVTGPMNQLHRASNKAGVEARAWVKELGKARALRVTSGCQYNTTPGQFRYSVCYSFQESAS